MPKNDNHDKGWFCKDIPHGRIQDFHLGGAQKIMCFMYALSCYLSLIFFLPFWYKMGEKNIVDQILGGLPPPPPWIRHCTRKILHTMF